MVGHVYDATNACRPIHIPDTIVNFTKNPIVNGDDQWSENFYMLDTVHHEMAIMEFTTNNGAHQAIQLFINTLTGNTISSQTVDVNSANGGTAGPNQPLNSDIQTGQFVDFYSDGDAGQVFWYGINTANIQFSYNFQLFGDSSFAPNVIATQFAPLISGQSLTFSSLGAYIQIGNQFQSPLSPSAIPLQATLVPPTASDQCSAAGTIPLVQNTNACEQLAGSQASGTIVTESMAAD